MIKSVQHLGNRLIAVLAVFLLLIGVYASITPHVVEADVNDEDAHLGFLAPDKKDEEERGPKYITRSLVIGNPIQVCSADYPIATPLAIERWNTALGITAFTVLEDPEGCDTEAPGWNPAEGIVSLIVSRGVWIDEGKTTFEGPVLEVTCPTLAWAGCAQFEYGNRKWRSFYGKAEIVMNPENLGVDHSGEGLVLHLAHELGHILGLADYYCHDKGFDIDVSDHPDRIDIDPETKLHPRTLMNSFTAREKCNSPDGRPTQLDKDDYKAAYLPATVTDLGGAANGQTVTLTWKQSDVFVESGFEIQREDGGTWVEVETVAANQTWAKLLAQPFGAQRYRIVARTMALPESETDHGHGHGPASAEVSVTVRLPAPASPGVTARGADSLTLTWDEVDDADGYDVRHTTTSDCEGDPVTPVTVLSHTFTGLSASTTYLLCVRATLTGTSEANSKWASVTETTTSESSPPSCPTQQPEKPNVREEWPASWQYYWDVRGDTAYEQRGRWTMTVVRTVDWQPHPDCKWKEGSWEKDPDVDPNPWWSGWSDTGVTKVKPDDETVVISTTTSWENRYVTDPGPPCLIIHETRLVTTQTVAHTTWSWGGSSWVSHTELGTRVFYSNWVSKGSSSPCTTEGVGQAGETLPAGQHLFLWDTIQVGFSVPEDAQVQLLPQWRASGLHATVLRVAGGAKLVIEPSNFVNGAAGTVDQIVTDPILAAIQQSLRAIEPTASGTSDERGAAAKCLPIPARQSGETLVKLEAGRCVTVHNGGALTVVQGGHTLSLALAHDRDWAVWYPAAGEESRSLLWLIDLATGSYVALDSATNAEVERVISKDAPPALSTWFDVLIDFDLLESE